MSLAGVKLRKTMNPLRILNTAAMGMRWTGLRSMFLSCRVGKCEETLKSIGPTLVGSALVYVFGFTFCMTVTPSVDAMARSLGGNYASLKLPPYVRRHSSSQLLELCLQFIQRQHRVAFAMDHSMAVCTNACEISFWIRLSFT